MRDISLKTDILNSIEQIKDKVHENQVKKTIFNVTKARPSLADGLKNEQSNTELNNFPKPILDAGKQIDIQTLFFNIPKYLSSKHKKLLRKMLLKYCLDEENSLQKFLQELKLNMSDRQLLIIFRTLAQLIKQITKQKINLKKKLKRQQEIQSESNDNEMSDDSSEENDHSVQIETFNNHHTLDFQGEGLFKKYQNQQRDLSVAQLPKLKELRKKVGDCPIIEQNSNGQHIFSRIEKESKQFSNSLEENLIFDFSNYKYQIWRQQRSQIQLLPDYNYFKDLHDKNINHNNSEQIQLCLDHCQFEVNNTSILFDKRRCGIKSKQEDSRQLDYIPFPFSEQDQEKSDNLEKYQLIVDRVSRI
ncbi:UNKNOWN [Stylonychia lemnae]|uniref:Uncharacterized protein n=1 Tax=Stylonychia lemnae TaxID=5949 RepID=A0A078APT5_STYLE|nr:UNKNOWN [Stylonychia lemnae]|eukprot:CDW83312.1 UNKNOWN [Stylonychia lemnae]